MPVIFQCTVHFPKLTKNGNTVSMVRTSFTSGIMGKVLNLIFVVPVYENLIDEEVHPNIVPVHAINGVVA
jgi:riboflavin transporter FmnP